MQTFKPGKFSEINPVNGLLQKTIRRSSIEDAERYANDVTTYDAMLRENGFMVPIMLGCVAEPTETGGDVVQLSEIIEGHDLRDKALSHNQRIGTAAEAVRQLAENPIDSDGNFMVPVDSNPGNFVDDGTYVYMVDTMPPLVSTADGSLPYHYQDVHTEFGRRWIDEFMRSQSGAIARLAVMSMVQRPEHLMSHRRLLGMNEIVAQLFALTDQNRTTDRLKRDVRRKMIPYLGQTLRRIGYHKALEHLQRV